MSKPLFLKQLNCSAQDTIWSFYNPVKIVFGSGVRALIGDLLRTKQPLALVCSPRGHLRLQNDRAFNSLTERKELIWVDNAISNPDIDLVQNQVDRLRLSGISAIVAVGGGSVIDTGKALASCLGNGSNQPLRKLVAEPQLLERVQSLPMVAVPTTAGTGSEVTPFATLWDYTVKKKFSLEGPSIFPKAAYIDPQLTVTLPESITVSSGLDAINQAAESIWNRNANLISLQFAVRALRKGIYALPRLLDVPDDMHARQDMMECGLFAGLAISHTRTALCHSMSYPLTSHFGVPHGLACAFTMLSVFDLNKVYDDGRLQQAAKFLELENVEALGELLEHILTLLQVRERVWAYVPSLKELKQLVSEMFMPNRANNNLAPVNHNNLLKILENSFSGSIAYYDFNQASVSTHSAKTARQA